jgi:hypothetical protein
MFWGFDCCAKRADSLLRCPVILLYRVDSHENSAKNKGARNNFYSSGTLDFLAFLQCLASISLAWFDFATNRC